MHIRISFAWRNGILLSTHTLLLSQRQAHTLSGGSTVGAAVVSRYRGALVVELALRGVLCWYSVGAAVGILFSPMLAGVGRGYSISALVGCLADTGAPSAPLPLTATTAAEAPGESAGATTPPSWPSAPLPSTGTTVGEAPGESAGSTVCGAIVGR